MRRLKSYPLVLALMLMASGRALAGGGLLGIDHEWSYDNNGIWKRSYQLDLEYGVIATGPSVHCGSGTMIPWVTSSGKASIRPRSQASPPRL